MKNKQENKHQCKNDIDTLIENNIIKKKALKKIISRLIENENLNSKLI